ncbi:hypothetical protein [Streptomyces ortus]|uniref:Uncharacterized protein n=1 Tax=Streptomyces ortus TaxID=2867268 RepID=A0ABT3V450_9ACTN|nr:hypothetical protein [Streptomyces ortus]MCX4234774.1 hypothetical protein [Streptomyces ortus]
MAESTDTSQSMSPADWASSVPARGRGSMGVYTQQCLLPANFRDAAPKTKQAQINLYVKQTTSAAVKDKIDSFATYGFADIMTLTRRTQGHHRQDHRRHGGDVFLGAPAAAPRFRCRRTAAAV